MPPKRGSGNYNLRKTIKKSATSALYDKRRRKNVSSAKRQTAGSAGSRSAMIIGLVKEKLSTPPASSTSTATTTLVASSQQQQETPITTPSDVIMVSDSEDEMSVDDDVIVLDETVNIITKKAAQDAMTVAEDSSSDVDATDVAVTPSVTENLHQGCTPSPTEGKQTSSKDGSSESSDERTEDIDDKSKRDAVDVSKNQQFKTLDEGKNEIAVQSSIEQTQLLDPSPDVPCVDNSTFDVTSLPDSIPPELNSESSTVEKTNLPLPVSPESSPEKTTAEKTNLPLPVSPESSPEKTTAEKTNLPCTVSAETRPEKSTVEKTNLPDSVSPETGAPNCTVDEAHLPEPVTAEPSRDLTTEEELNSPDTLSTEPSPEKSTVDPVTPILNSTDGETTDSLCASTLVEMGLNIFGTTDTQALVTQSAEMIQTVFLVDHVRSVLQSHGVMSAMTNLVETLSKSARSLDIKSAAANKATCIAAGITDVTTLDAVSTVLEYSDVVVGPLCFQDIVEFDDELLSMIRNQAEVFGVDNDDYDDSIVCNPPSVSRSSVDSDVLLPPTPDSQTDIPCHASTNDSSTTTTSSSSSPASKSKRDIDEDNYHSGSEADDSLDDPDYAANEASDSESTASSVEEEQEPDSVSQKTPAIVEHGESSDDLSSETATPSESLSHSVQPTAGTSQYSGVKVSSYTKDPDNKRVSRLNFCFFCKKPNSHIARHLKRVHGKEPAVAAILAKEDSVPKSEISRMYEKLRKAGDSQHNQEVLSAGTGVLRPSRRRKIPIIPEDLVVCVFCKAWVLKTVLFIHLRTCKIRYPPPDKEIHPRYAAATAYVATHSRSNISEDFRTKALEKMVPDAIHEAIVGDDLILRFGGLIFDNMDGVNTQVQQTRNNMREAGRLLLAVKRIDASVICFKDLLCVNKWDLLVSSVLALTKMDAGIKSTSTPSLAIKVGYHLQKMCDIILGDAIKTGDERLQNEIQSFTKLRDLQWTSKVVKKARRNLQRKKLNRKDLVPLTEDLILMSKYIITNLERLQKLLEDNKAETADWIFFSRLLLVKVVMFNFKRVGEISNFELTEYAVKTKGDLRQDIAQGLSKSQAFMASHMTRVETVGKCTKNVPLLLTEQMVTWIDILISTRKEVGNVPDKNVYVFANPQAYTTGYINGYDSFRQVARDCGAKSHELIRSTKLRHHIAMSSQILDLNHYELEQLATFMGHTLDVHRNFYRLPDSTIQVAKVSLLLHAMDQNDMSQFAGKSLDEIELEDLPLAGDSDEEASDDNDVLDEGIGELPITAAPHNSDTMEPQPSTSGVDTYEPAVEVAQNMEVVDPTIEAADDDVIKTSRLKRRQGRPKSAAPKATTTTREAPIPDSTPRPMEPVQHTAAKRNRDNYVLWSEQELAAIQRGFAANFASLVRPKKQDFEEFMKKEAAAMARRTFKKVRDHVQSKITTLKNKQLDK